VATLGSYITDVRRILHDANATYWPDSDLTSFVNRALKQRDRDSGMHRALATIATVAGTPSYPLANIAPFYPEGTPAPGTVFDIMNVVLIWTTQRTMLMHVPFTDLASFYQPYQNYRNVPVVYTLYGAKHLFIAPSPQQVYQMDLDCVLVSPDLVVAADTDPLPDPWGDPVPFLAAAFAKDELGQSDEGMKYRRIYAERLLNVSGSRTRMLTQPYSSVAGF